MIRLCRQEPLAITSIGLDGELIDNVTALPKPRIFVYAGMIVATAEDCLKAAEAEYEIIGTTGVQTPLGTVQILRILREGNCLVAGPSTLSGMNALIATMEELQPGKILIDGAFSRKALMRASDACIFAVGAVRSPNLDEVIRATTWSIRQFNLPKTSIELDYLREIPNITLVNDDGTWMSLPTDSVITDPNSVFAALTEKTAYLYLPGSFGPLFAKEWIRHRRNHLPDIILQSPAHLVVPEDLLELLFQMKNRILVQDPVRLIGVAYNPFSPTGYEFDDLEFRTKLSGITDLPVFNVLHESEEEDEQA